MSYYLLIKHTSGGDLNHALGKTLSRLACGLALVAALGSGLLPGGFLPKVAGRCGRELCSCAPEIIPCSQAHCKAAPRVLSFLHSSISNADAPGVALQFVFSGLLSPLPAVPLPVSDDVEMLAIPSAQFALGQTVSEILTPPPRLAA